MNRWLPAKRYAVTMDIQTTISREYKAIFFAIAVIYKIKKYELLKYPLTLRFYNR
jgi:hypothetical protein